MNYSENDSTPLVSQKYKNLKFNTCVSCGSCGDVCAFSHHRVTFIIDYRYHRFISVNRCYNNHMQWRVSKAMRDQF